MTMTLDWNRFRTRGIGPERAFEAFAAQLFERWLRREHGTDVETYTLKGAGGDGGVEAFAKLKDGSVVGLQAKWFPDNLDDAGIRKIRASLDSARNTHAKLTTYVVAIPQNLTTTAGLKSKAPKRGRPKKGGLERWNEFVEDVGDAYPDLAIRRWDQAAQEAELSCSENHELYPVWFEGSLDLEILKKAWDRARAILRDRYLPDLHAVGDFDAIVAGALWSQQWRVRQDEVLERVSSEFVSARQALTDFRRASDDRRPEELTRALDQADTSIAGLLEHTAELRHALSRGPSRSIHPLPSGRALWTLRSEITSFKEKESYLADLGADPTEAAYDAWRRLSEVDADVRQSAFSCVVSGPPGCGKTHAGARAVEAALESGLPAVFISARDHDPHDGAQVLLAKALDLTGWPLRRMLDALEGLAILAATDVESSAGLQPFDRALVLVDGLEESQGWRDWERVLAELDVEAERRPRIHVMATARTETLDALTLPPDLSWHRLGEDSGTDLPIMLRRYASAYQVDLGAVPWLPWAVRTPLEVRLLAEEFEGRALTIGDSAQLNMLGLFRRKRDRIEEQARGRAGRDAWSARVHLIAVTLKTLSALALKSSSGWVPESDVIGGQSSEPEYTAGRVRLTLTVLREEGLIDEYLPPDRGLMPAVPEYRLATRHLADFMLATSAFEDSGRRVAAGDPVQFPTALRGRSAATTIFFAMLAENGMYATDVAWVDPPSDLFGCHARAMALVPTSVASARADEFRAALIQTTAKNRDVLAGVVLPASRVPGHPLGALLLDAALRAVPLCERDPIWSVPDDLHDDGPWRGNYSTVLDEIALHPEADAWDGRPLILAWACSSVVERRQMRARAELAAWGARRLGDMTRLLERMATCDDPQVVGDVTVAAFGAAAGADVGDPALRDLALLVDGLFFSPNAAAPTASVQTRMAARGIIERAALIFPEELAAIVPRARPPYEPRGPAWPAVDGTESFDHWGGPVVHGDLSWYVADRTFRKFDDLAYPLGSGDHDPGVDSSLLRAMASGELPTPPGLEGAVKEHSEAMERYRGFAILRDISADDAKTEADDSESDGAARPSMPAAVARALASSRETLDPVDDRRHSSEFRELLRHAASSLGMERISIGHARNAMIAHLVRRWGWSEGRFRGDTVEGSATGVDRAIGRQYRSATHGSRSDVCDFCEKYVWSAVDIIAGELADRCPVWSGAESRWVRLRALDGVGNGLPDPLPRFGNGTPSEVSESTWEAKGILPVQFASEVNLAVRAEKWLAIAPVPDVREFIRAQGTDLADASVLALEHFRGRHQSCVQQLVRVRAFATRPEHLDFLARDLPHLGTDMTDANAGIVEGVYSSPAVACWASWLPWGGLDHGYRSYTDSGQPLELELRTMVAELTTRGSGEDDAREGSAWCPVPWLAHSLGIVGMEGTSGAHRYLNRERSTIAIEHELPDATFHRGNHFLLVDREQYARIISEQGLVPVWFVRMLREPTPALFMSSAGRFRPLDGLKHRSRDLSWMVVERNGVLESTLLADTLEPWERTEATGD